MTWFTPSPCHTHTQIFLFEKILLACYFWLKFEPKTCISKITTATSAILPSIKFRSWTESEKRSQFNPDIDAQCPFCVTNIFKIHSPQSLNYITSNYWLKKMQSVWINEVIYCSHYLCHIRTPVFIWTTSRD